MNELDALRTKAIAQQALVLQQERDEARAKVAELEKHLAYEKENAAILVAAVADIQNDLKAAQRAAELAATHREALEQVVREMRDGLQDCWDSEFSLDEFVSLKERATELLGEVTQ